MGEYYRIKEVARLYGLCPDTLRYYEEQGLLSPARGENNYRMYGIQDICRLNIIQDLRSLDMPVARIQRYMESRSVDSTLALLSEETALIDARIDALRELRGQVIQRTQGLQEARALPVGEFRLLSLPDRPRYLLSEGLALEEDIDFLLKKLAHKHEDKLRSFGDRQIGATLDAFHFANGVYHQYANAFYICEGAEDYDDVIPGGIYASVVYEGRYEHMAEYLKALLAFIAGQGRKPASPPIELYHIDVHATRTREEYVTEIQIQL